MQSTKSHKSGQMCKKENDGDRGCSLSLLLLSGVFSTHKTLTIG